jgi:alkanesulfonate monooxygenase SsuD/methylene tetrahydromethanopterin reductase-like flavin-dependent oxidoreductase (luciferase family)
MLAGLNDRILTLAAERADIVGHTAIWQAEGKPPGTLRLGTHEDFAERVRFFRERAGDRVDEIEANFLIQAVLVTDDPPGALEKLIAERGLEYTAQELLDAPTNFVGTLDEIVAKIDDYRDRYGITYFTVHEPYMRAFGPVIAKIRERA